MKIIMTQSEACKIMREFLGNELITEVEISISDDDELERFVKTVRETANGGNKITAIKYYRAVTSAGLADSKHAVECIMVGKYVDNGSLVINNINELL